MTERGVDGQAVELNVEFLAAIIEHVAHPIFVKDRDYRFVLLNRALCEMVGHAKKDMLGKTDYDFFPKAQADFFRDTDATMFASKKAVTVVEEPITDAQGAIHVLQTTKVPYLDRDGEVTHLVGIISDITAVKQAEEMLRTANERLELRVRERSEALRLTELELVRKERLAALGQLAGGLAHQLRNPLGVMQNAVSLLRRASLEAGALQAVDIVAEEVQRADRIIHDLLDYARIRCAEPREVVLREVLVEAIEQERPLPSVAVEIDVDPLVTVCVDPLQVQNAVGNVIRNAIEAMPQGGRVSLSAEHSDEWAVVLVRDTGEGVLESVRAHLFDPLVTSKTQGVGLGLSTARNLIEAQGGCIDHVPSERGATFAIRLPRSSERRSLGAAGAQHHLASREARVTR